MSFSSPIAFICDLNLNVILKVVKYLLTDGRLDPNIKDEILQAYYFN